MVGDNLDEKYMENRVRDLENTIILHNEKLLNHDEKIDSITEKMQCQYNVSLSTNDKVTGLIKDLAVMNEMIKTIATKTKEGLWKEIALISFALCLMLIGILLKIYQ